MASWTKPSDVTGAWIGEGAPTSDTLIQTWIDKAERAIKLAVPDIQTRITAESPATDLLDTTKDVVVAMVTRVFRNPESIRQTNITTGPYTASKTYGGDTPGEFEPTDKELAKLQGKTDGAFTIDMIPSTSPFSARNAAIYPWC